MVVATEMRSCARTVFTCARGVPAGRQPGLPHWQPGGFVVCVSWKETPEFVSEAIGRQPPNDGLTTGEAAPDSFTSPMTLDSGEHAHELPIARIAMQYINF